MTDYKQNVWQTYRSGRSLFVVDKRNNAIICRIMVGDAFADVRDANAQLISAAPDLLEVLEDAVSLIGYLQKPYIDATEFDCDGLIEQAKAAIAKARGE